MPAHPDLIVRRATVRTLDPDQPTCSAVAINDGLIVAAGDDDSIRAMRGPGTNVVDTREIAITPGLTSFAADPVAADADDLLDLPILMTIVDGRIVHEAREILMPAPSSSKPVGRTITASRGRAETGAFRVIPTKEESRRRQRAVLCEPESLTSPDNDHRLRPPKGLR